jgi:hypothetical protein
VTSLCVPIVPQFELAVHVARRLLITCGHLFIGHHGGTTVRLENDSNDFVAAPDVLRLGPEWGEPLQVCAECKVESEVGAKDPDDGVW